MEGFLAGGENNPSETLHSTKPPLNLGELMNSTSVHSKNDKMNSEQMKNGLKLLGDMMNLSNAAKANNTEGTKSALVSLTTDLVNMKSSNTTEGEYSKIESFLTHALSNETDTNSEQFQNETQSVGSLIKEKINFFGSRKQYLNMTDVFDNSTDTGNGTSGNFPNFDELKTGLSHREILNLDDLPPVDLNKTYTHSNVLSVMASLAMITFFYYVPRMLYYRVSNMSNDSKHSSFVPLLYLSLVACIGAVVHVTSAYYKATHNIVADMISGNFDFGEKEKDMFTPFLYRAMCASINRLVSPIVALLCLQQISTHSKYSIQIFQNTGVQWIYCLMFTAIIFGYTFYKEHAFLESLEAFNYPDPIHVDLMDLVFPFITTFLFFFAKHAISRQSLYTTEKYGPNGPTTLDRVSKAVVFQAVMSFFAICAIFWGPSEEEEKSLNQSAYTFQYFFITAQTPFVHFVLFRSLLRSRKSTRICFLVCCHSGEKVSTADNEVELNQHPRTNEPSEKNEEDDENKEEETMETLDHNKIIIMPEGGLEEKPEMKEKNDEKKDEKKNE